MKKTILMMLVAMVCSLSAFAQSADQIVGTYKAEQDGKVSKIKIFKYKDGYRGQVFWVKETKNADGSIKTDVKNPDKAKQKTPVDQIVIIDKVVFNGTDTWKDGRIYDPTSGKTYKVEVKMKDAKTLEVKGKLGPFSKKVYWPKLS